jgi:uncharacterized protein YjbI with pentapeptide repeats
MVNYNEEPLINEVFTSQDLSSIPFINTTLTNCQFDNCILDYCQFLSCTLSGCSFTNCSFIGTDFNTSNFQNISISGASFSSTNFSNAVFQDYSIFNNQDDFSNCIFDNVDLQTELQGKILKNCSFVNTNFSLGTLDNVDFSFSIFENTNFANATLTNLNLDDTTLSNLDFSDLDLSNSISLRNSTNQFIYTNESTILPTVDLSDRTVSYEIKTSIVAGTSGQTTLSYLIGPYINFEGKNLNGIDFRGLDLTSVNLMTNDLQNCKSIGITYDDPPVLNSGYQIVKSCIVGPYMNIVSADLSDEDLSSVNFFSVKTRLNTANENTSFPEGYGFFGQEVDGQVSGSVIGPDIVLIQAELENVDLSEADLTGIRTGLTTTNENTILPTGYKAVGNYILGPNVSLQQVTLTGLDLSGVDFTGCIFRNTKAQGTVTTDSSTIFPQGYVVSNGFLLGPNINISNIDFASAIVDFSTADLTGVRSGNILNSDNVTLPTGYSVVNTFILGPNISYVNSVAFDNENFDSIDFTGADFTSASFTNCVFANCLFDNILTVGTDFTGSQFTTCSFGSGLVFDNVNFTSTTFSGGTTIFDIGTNFTNCSFTNMTNFSSYSVINKKFDNCDFSNCVMDGDFSGTQFDLCNISGADLSSSVLIGCIGTNLTTDSTVLPSNYIISGGTLISTLFSTVEDGILLEPETGLTDDTTDTYVSTMLAVVTEEEFKEGYTIENRTRIFINTSVLGKLENSDLMLTEIISSDNLNSQVTLDDIDITVAYYVTLYNIGEEVVINLPIGRTIKIRRRNVTQYQIVKDNVEQIENTGFTDEYFGFNYTLGSVSGYFLPSATICFPAGEFVLTNEGYINIKNLNPLEHKINEKSIEKISRTTTKEKVLVQIDKDALGINQPNKMTLVSLNHQIFFNGGWFLAKRLTNLPSIKYVPYQGQTLYNVQLNTPDTMMVNNMIVETLMKNKY